jgi:hypothetical protein
MSLFLWLCEVPAFPGALCAEIGLYLMKIVGRLSTAGIALLAHLTISRGISLLLPSLSLSGS